LDGLNSGNGEDDDSIDGIKIGSKEAARDKGKLRILMSLITGEKTTQALMTDAGISSKKMLYSYNDDLIIAGAIGRRESTSGIKTVFWFLNVS
jgi:hypothetical protein